MKRINSYNSTYNIDTEGDKYLSSDQMKNVELLMEGIYINESINHLRSYLQSKGGESAQPCLTNNVFEFNPQACFVTVTSTFLKDKDRILIKTILDKLSKNTNGMSTKFVMMCCIRPEIGENNKFCNGSSAALEFAASVSSTKTSPSINSRGSTPPTYANVVSGKHSGGAQLDYNMKLSSSNVTAFVWGFITFLAYVVSVYITDAILKSYFAKQSSIKQTRMIYTLLLLCVFSCILAIFALVTQNMYMFGMCALTLILFGFILYGVLKQSSYT
jgi:hypothetical protein